MTWTVYIVECSDGTLYTGVTNNLEKRLRNHNSRRGGRYTKGRAPVTLRYTEGYGTKSQAMKREEQLKGWTRAKKIALIHGNAEKLRSLSRRREQPSTASGKSNAGREIKSSHSSAAVDSPPRPGFTSLELSQ